MSSLILIALAALASSSIARARNPHSARAALRRPSGVVGDRAPSTSPSHRERGDAARRAARASGHRGDHSHRAAHDARRSSDALRPPPRVSLARRNHRASPDQVHLSSPSARRRARARQDRSGVSQRTYHQRHGRDRDECLHARSRRRGAAASGAARRAGRHAEHRCQPSDPRLALGN